MINQLIANIKKTGAPIVVGLDPMLKYIPEHIQKKAFAEFGETLEGAAEAIWQFNKEIVDKTYDLIPAVKPQIAMYEQFGIPGLVAFKKTVDYCKSKGLVVIGDIKRGDIGLAINEHPDIIGIIDGVFHQNSAVAHREILKAIDEGITVVGASSMGALRASELDTLGMKGIGYVYEQYATGKVTSDDDVAVMLDSETLEQLSEPLINMEYTFTKAVKENQSLTNQSRCNRI